ncbi:CobW family GTP-binding protein [Roseburia hominis]
MTKVDIISGFLGAGKTTFIKKLIEEVFPGEKLVLIENEFGEIGIDGGFLKDAGVEITEMNSGCICCTLVGDFSKALQQVLSEYQPDRVIIEPSGVGKLSDVVKAIEGVKAEADIGISGRITVVDGKKAKVYLKNFGEFFSNQVEHASTIVMSRTQMMTNEKIESCVHLLREKNQEAAIITTPWDELGKDAILRALEQGAEIEELLHAHDHHHDDECCHEHHHEGECGHHHGVECGHEYGDEGCLEHHGEAHHHDEECGCGHHHDEEHEHHHHDGECGCGHHHDEEHEHHHDGECGCGHHHDEEHEHHHNGECGCGHHHDEEHEHRHHDGACGCGHHHDEEHEHHHHDGECGCGHHHHDGHHHADEIFTSWGKETAHKYTETEMDFILKALSETEGYGTILRAKGIVQMENGTWKQFDMVPEEYEVREGQPDYTGRICVIGTDLKEDELKTLFHI